jgi:hypothetical protein
MHFDANLRQCCKKVICDRGHVRRHTTATVSCALLSVHARTLVTRCIHVMILHYCVLLNYVYVLQVEEAVGLECEDKQDWEVAVKR